MKLFYRKTGEGDPVVILHGLFGMSDNWQSFARMLAEKGFAVYSVDLRNHGQSFHDPVFNYTVMAEDLFELFTKEDLFNVTLIGHSMGGKVAMQFSFMYGNLVDRLVVVDIAPRYYQAHHGKILEALNAVDLAMVQSRKEAEGVLDKYNLSIETRQFLLKNLYWKSESQLAWRFNLTSIENSIENVGNEVNSLVPFMKHACFIRGEKSDYILDTDWPQIIKLFPLAELKTVAGAGHWIHADNPVELLKLVYEFQMQ